MYVLDRIRATAMEAPDRPALVFNNSPVSYDTFWRLIDGCRQALAPHAPRHGLALLSVHNLLEGWILDLALRGLGLDTAAIPEAHQSAFFPDQTITCLVTLQSDPRPEIAIPADAVRLTVSPPSAQVFTAGAPLPPAPALAGGGHFLLTSGTTGAPKPVFTAIGRAEAASMALKSLAEAMGDPFSARGPDTTYCLFDLGLWTAGGYVRTVSTWCVGGAVVFDQRGAHHLALEWPGITHVMPTPHYLARVLTAPEGAFAYRPDIHLVMTSGAMTPATLREVRRRLTPKIAVFVGSTEVGSWARTVVETDDDLVWHRVTPDRVVQVVDETGEAVPTGELGLVRIGLRQAGAATHLGDAAEAAKVFEDGWFYPGDLGVMDERGRISLRGRSADVVSIEGVKYPTEPWERALRDRLGCDEVCVMAARSEDGSEQLHVFIEAASAVSLARVVEAMRATLAGFPEAQVHRIEALPRTPLGKVRRVELAQRLQSGEFSPPPPTLPSV